MKRKESLLRDTDCIEMAETIPTHAHSAAHEPKTHTLLTREELEQFKELALSEYGVALTDDQVYEQATALLTLFEALLEKHLAFGRQNDIITKR